MIDETYNCTGTLMEAEPYVSVPASQYERYLRMSIFAENAAEAISEDWIASAERGYGEPSDTLKILLRLYNRELYRKTKQRVKEAEEKHQHDLSEMLKNEIEKQTPVYPYVQQDPPGWPYKGIEITCEDKIGDHE